MAERGARYAQQDAVAALAKVSGRTPAQQAELEASVLAAGAARTAAGAEVNALERALASGELGWIQRLQVQQDLVAAKARRSGADRELGAATDELESPGRAAQAVALAGDEVKVAADARERAAAGLGVVTGGEVAARAARRLASDAMRAIRDDARAQRAAGQAVERAERAGDRATRAAAGRLADHAAALAAQYAAERAMHDERRRSLSAADEAMATLRRQEADGGSLGALERAYLRRLEQAAGGREAERGRMTRRALAVAQALRRSLARLIARLKRKTSGSAGETEQDLAALEELLGAVGADIAALEHAAKARRTPGLPAKPDPVEAAAGEGGGDSDAPGPGRSARAAGHAVSTSHGRGVTATRSVVLGRLAQPDALTVAEAGVLHPSGGLYSSWPAFGLCGGPDDPRRIATSSQGFASVSTSEPISPPAVPAAVAAACKPACCKDCPPGAVCACPPPDPIVVEGATVTEATRRIRGGGGGAGGGGGGGGGGGVGSGGGGAAGPTVDVPVRPPPETTPSQPNVRPPPPPPPPLSPPDLEDVDDPVEDGDEPPIVRLHPEVVAAREAQLELDRLVEAFWALVDEVNRLLELVAPPSFSDLGGQYALRARATFDRPLKILKGRLHEATEAMNLLLGEHEHRSDQREAGWTGATKARSRAVELFDALRSVAVQSAMAVEAAAHFRLGASLAAKGADFTWPGWRAARRVADAEFRAADLILERMVQQIGDRRVPAEDMEHWAATTALRVNDLEFASRDDRGFLGSRFLAGLEIGLAVLGIAAAPLKGLGAAVRAATRARLGPLMRAGGPRGRLGATTAEDTITVFRGMSRGEYKALRDTGELVSRGMRSGAMRPAGLAARVEHSWTPFFGRGGSPMSPYVSASEVSGFAGRFAVGADEVVARLVVRRADVVWGLNPHQAEILVRGGSRVQRLFLMPPGTLSWGPPGALARSAIGTVVGASAAAAVGYVVGRKAREWIATERGE